MTLSAIDPVSALVVIDLQDGVVRPSEPGMAVVTQAARLAAEYRRQHMPVVLVTAIGLPPGRTDVRMPSGAELPAGFADLPGELDPQPSDHLIAKRCRSAFHETGLDGLLRELGATQVVLTGVSTSSGVESTARCASDHGYNVVLVTDAMYDPDAEAHRHTIDRVFPKIGETATVTDVIEGARLVRGHDRPGGVCEA